MLHENGENLSKKMIKKRDNLEEANDMLINEWL